MSRDFRKLRAFSLADRLVIDVYRVSAQLPAVERFSLQTQMRRAAISVAANIVEGSARRTTREYLSFLNIAAGSAAEARYLVDVSRRLGFVAEEEGASLVRGYIELSGTLQALLRSFSGEP